MNSWQRWLRAPATHCLHRVMFQLHLWLGIGFGLYVLVMSISGSAVVLRPYFPGWFIHNTVTPGADPVPAAAAIRANAELRYSKYRVVDIQLPSRPDRAARVELERSGQRQVRYFDQYRSQDLGPDYPWQVATMEWMTHLHDELLLGRTGTLINGFGGLLFLLMLVSGSLIWWRGKASWHRALLFSRRSPRSVAWQLHCVLGFWTLPLMFVWGSTAMYFAWPSPFEGFIDWMDDDPYDAERPDGWLLLLLDLHFGRFRGLLWANVLWILLGLLPALHFITGLCMWYRRSTGRQRRPRLPESGHLSGLSPAIPPP